MAGGVGIKWLDGSYYAGGGSSGSQYGDIPGGLGGGGTGGTAGSSTRGTAGTGGGGGGTRGVGGANQKGLGGGSGVVIIRYPTSGSVS
jgi:hypothetical protein